MERDDDMGLNEDLCALTALTGDQLADVERLAGLTSQQVAAFSRAIDRAWNANVAAVQDAMAAATEARKQYGAACLAITAIARRPGWQRRRLLDELTRDEKVELADAEAVRLAAYEAVAAADGLVGEAQTRFKAGVTAEQLENG